MFFRHHFRHVMSQHESFGNHRGHRHKGRFGSHRGEEFPGARKLSADELQLVILALLSDSPAHGYELIRRLEERSNGFYKPSPGMVYPALTYLEEIGQTAVTQEGTRKLYSLTSDGSAHLAANRSEANRILDLLDRIGRRMGEVREAFAGLHDLDPKAADDLHAARHALKTALYKRRGCSPANARRITDILVRAAKEIEEEAQS